MKKTTVVWGILLALMVALAGCGGGDNSGEASSSSGGVTLNEGYPDALPVSVQLSLGTMLLEETEDAVTTEQAGDLLPNWQMLQALQGSGTAAQAELVAVLNQIQAAMTPEQLMAIKEMQLTSASMSELAQQSGFARGFAGGEGRPGGSQPPAGVVPGGGGGRGGGVPGAGLGQKSLSPGEQADALAERMNTFMGTAMTDMLISLLEARAEGQVFEIASPNQGFESQRALIAAASESMGLDQQEIMAQVREGKTLAEIAEANGADLDEIVAQVVAAETERINQAVADGALEQTTADEILAGLEARVRQALEQPLQFGGRGAPGGESGQP